VKKVDDFLNDFFQGLKLYRHHAFVTTAQATFYKDTKKDLEENEVLVVCDFAENYSFVVQDEIQSFHWINEMATVQPFVAYYKTGTTMQHIKYVVISEWSTHDTVAVHLYIKLFLKYLKNCLPSTVLPRGRNFGRRTQKGPYKNLCGRKSWRPNFLSICQKRGQTFLKLITNIKSLKYLQKSTLHLLISLIFTFPLPKEIVCKRQHLWEDFVGGRIFSPAAEFFGWSGRRVISEVGNTVHPPRKLSTFLMDVLGNTKTARTLSTFATTEKILALMLNGIFLQQAMEKVLVTELGGPWKD
jgi:hypothetical protein